MAYNLKDESETKEYIENLGIEYRFGCYHEKKPEVCHLLGDFFEAVKKDFEKAGKVYEVNCSDYKHGHSCFKIGNYYFTGKGGLKSDHEKAQYFFDVGCENKYSDACLHGALMRHSSASKVTQDPKIALEKFEKGCTLDNNTCCYYLSGMYISGVENTVDKNMPKAFEYSEKACHLGNMFACANTSQMYRKGDGVPQNISKAEEYKKQALEMQDQLRKQFESIKFGEGG